MVEPSYSLEAEQAVLSTMLMAGSGKVADTIARIISADMFYLVEHRDIWAAMVALRSKGQDIDPALIYDHNERISLDYLVDICSSFTSTSNASTYAGIVRDRAQERSATTALYDAISALSDKDAGEWPKRLKRAEDQVLAALGQSTVGSAGLVHIESIAKLWTKDLVDRIDGVNPVSGFGTGIKHLDNLIGPKLMPPGSLVVVGARPKMGKSALLTMMADHFAGKMNLNTAIFSMEMPSNQVWERLLTGGTKLSPDKFYEPLTPDDYYKISEYSSSRMKAPLYVDDTPGITVGHIKSEARKLSRKGQVGLVCVDYLTLMDVDKADRNDLAYGKITKELKQLARELGCVVLLLTQLNRKIEDKPIMDRKPMPSDSRDTGQIEQDCDLWMGLFRAGGYDPECKHPGLTHIMVRLNRHGKTGTSYLNMREGYFVEVDKYDAEMMDEDNANYISPPKKSGAFRG